MVMGIDQNSSVVWGNPAVDITGEVIKRLDASPKPPAKK
jgi:Skp family chaperone for outer membrane proteins